MLRSWAGVSSRSMAGPCWVTQHGLFKVLGKGKLPNQPIVVRAKFFSKLAATDEDHGKYSQGIAITQLEDVCLVCLETIETIRSQCLRKRNPPTIPHNSFPTPHIFWKY